MKYFKSLTDLIYCLLFQKDQIEKIFQQYRNFFYYGKSLYLISSFGFSVSFAYFFSLSLFTFLFLVFLNYLIFFYFSFYQIAFIDYYIQYRGKESKIEVLHNINSICLLFFVFMAPLSFFLAYYKNSFGYYFFLFLIVFFLYISIFSESIFKIYSLEKKDLFRLVFRSLFSFGNFSFWLFFIAIVYFFIFSFNL